MIVLLQLGQWIIGKILGRIPMAIKDKFVAAELTITLSWRIVGLGGKLHNDFTAQATTANPCIDQCNADFPNPTGDPVSTSSRGWCYILLGCWQ